MKSNKGHLKTSTVEPRQTITEVTEISCEWAVNTEWAQWTKGWLMSWVKQSKTAQNTQNDKEFKPYKLFTLGVSYLIFLDHQWVIAAINNVLWVHGRYCVHFVITDL